MCHSGYASGLLRNHSVGVKNGPRPSNMHLRVPIVKVPKDCSKGLSSVQERLQKVSLPLGSGPSIRGKQNHINPELEARCGHSRECVTVAMHQGFCGITV